jgi:hypothetical protein
MSSSATFGLAVTSHADGTLCTSTMDNVSAVVLPAQPTGLNATAGNSQVALSWTASPGATSYNLKRATINGGPHTTVTNVTATNYTDISLSNGTTYYYVVSALNAGGESANSSQVSATPTNHPPVLEAISNQTILAGRTLVVTNSAGDTDAPPQLLTYSLSAAPPGVSINTNSGVVTWRPAIAQSPGTQSVVVVVSDMGVPVMSATQSFWVTVNAPGPPVLSPPEFANQSLHFLVSGDVGPDYTIQRSTNLNSGSNWVNYFTTNSPPLPFSFVDPVDMNADQQFYRIQLGP